MFTLQDRVVEIADQVETFQRLKLELTRCPYSPDDFLRVLRQLQGVIDELSALKCHFMNEFNQTADQAIEAILKQRVEGALNSWLVAFRRRLREENADMVAEEEAISEERETVSDRNVYEKVLQLNCVHSIRIIHRNLAIVPPLAESKKRWYDSLFVSAAGELEARKSSRRSFRCLVCAIWSICSRLRKTRWRRRRSLRW